eukprot:gnl/TRDRNA2_/TRDRNA2_157080_c1_seq1.p1 gnl/TRDRNA2_/TRDRNA2_157080_c1~~gnl/TRDRNA2_/TRDRNA2_157080_c1_seq1.p1  ORF type:complete len:321 (-),score=24.79 gnl/TRDRNA2_/TRDRNA2_157080_c1_seq1:541-1503(-)
MYLYSFTALKPMFFMYEASVPIDIMLRRCRLLPSLSVLARLRTLMAFEAASRTYLRGSLDLPDLPGYTIGPPPQAKKMLRYFLLAVIVLTFLAISLHWSSQILMCLTATLLILAFLLKRTASITLSACQAEATRCLVSPIGNRAVGLMLTLMPMKYKDSRMCCGTFHWPVSTMRFLAMSFVISMLDFVYISIEYDVTYPTAAPDLSNKDDRAIVSMMLVRIAIAFVHYVKVLKFLVELGRREYWDVERRGCLHYVWPPDRFFESWCAAQADRTLWEVQDLWAIYRCKNGEAMALAEDAPPVSRDPVPGVELSSVHERSPE